MGETEQGENFLETAKREFEEETGNPAITSSRWLNTNRGTITVLQANR
jgi:hypothetical protein